MTLRPPSALKPVARATSTRRANMWPLLYVAPALIIVGLVLALPILYSLYVAFHQYRLVDPGIGGFVGLENFRRAFSDERFINALTNTFRLALPGMLVPLCIGTGLAVALNNVGRRYADLYLTILLLPLFVPYVAGGLTWLMILHPQQGIANYLIGLVGVDPVAWLGDPRFALWTIVAVDAWHQTSLVVLLVYSALIGVPEEPVDAARIDGATSMQLFFLVIVPLIRRVLVTAAMIRLIMSFLTYDLIYVLTQGGPGIATEVLSYFIGIIAFRHLDVAYASALSWILLGIVVVLVVVSLTISRQDTTG